MLATAACAWQATLYFSKYDTAHAEQRREISELYAREVAQDRTRLCVSLPRGRADACVDQVEHGPTSAETKSAQYDLQAQQDMARWALGMLLVGGGTLLLTLVGVVLLAWTLLATQDALREAEAATDAAERNVEATRQIGEAQVRAYLQSDLPILKCGEEGGAQSVSLNMKNSGSSPAQDVRIRAGYAVGLPTEFASGNVDAAFASLKMSDEVSVQSYGAGEVRASPPVRLPDLGTPDARAVRAGQKVLFLGVVLSYVDVFGCTFRIQMATTTALVDQQRWEFATLKNHTHVEPQEA